MSPMEITTGRRAETCRTILQSASEAEAEPPGELMRSTTAPNRGLPITAASAAAAFFNSMVSPPVRGLGSVPFWETISPENNSHATPRPGRSGSVYRAASARLRTRPAFRNTTGAT